MGSSWFRYRNQGNFLTVMRAVTAESLSDDRARETYGKVLVCSSNDEMWDLILQHFLGFGDVVILVVAQGVVFSPVSFHGDLLSSRPEQVSEQWREDESLTRGVLDKLKAIVNPVRLIFHGEEVSLSELCALMRLKIKKDGKSEPAVVILISSDNFVLLLQPVSI